MASCVTCGIQLHPERAEKYDSCLERECREQNARGLKILAYAVNKAADQYEVADGKTRAETVARAYQPERRPSVEATRPPARTARPERPAADLKRGSDPSWTVSQQHLALVYNARGVRPDEIAGRLGLPTRTVIQMLLAAKQPA